MEKKISYTHKKSKRAKRMRLAVYCDGSVVVTSPFGIQQSLVEKFISDKKQWILSKILFFKSVDSKAIRTFSHKDYLENKDKAYELVHERVRFYNEAYGFSFNKISIKNQKTRWGSCSCKQNLNLNYKIVFLPQKHRGIAQSQNYPSKKSSARTSPSPRAKRAAPPRINGFLSHRQKRISRKWV